MNSLYLPQLMSTKLTNFKDTLDTVVLLVSDASCVDWFASYSSSTCFDHVNNKLAIEFSYDKMML